MSYNPKFVNMSDAQLVAHIAAEKRAGREPSDAAAEYYYRINCT